MYLDIYIFGNIEPWYFWDVYTYLVNLIDFVMIVALIVDKDFLGLHKVKNKVCAYLRTSGKRKVI
jgi:hypothetical protein